MTNDIVQTLIATREENEFDVDEIVDEIVDAGLLTERQAEAVIRLHLTTDSVEAIADEWSVTESRVYNARQNAEEKLIAADKTIAAIRDARDRAQPDPTTQ